MNKRKIAIFTGNRSEYGLQFPVLKAVEKHPDLEYQLIVSGAHLDVNFGRTLQEIENDGFRIHAEVKTEMVGHTHYTTARAIGSGILSLSHALNDLHPDIVVAFGDRFESFAMVIASSQMHIPTAHIEGGDLTEGGTLDDSVRHAMTKLSHLHFTSNQQATNRILAMGEEEWRVYTVGFTVLDLINNGMYASEKEVAEYFQLDTSRPIVIFTQHPVSADYQSAAAQIEQSLSALITLAEQGMQIIITYPNNDVGADAIISRLIALEKSSVKGIQIHKSIGCHLYHGILGLAKNTNNRIVCVGNSSSGIMETIAFGCPTVNIGSRQQGRLRGNNILDVDYSCAAIINAVNNCLYNESFRKKCREAENPYYMGGAGNKIADVLANIALDQKLLRKRMMLKGELNDGWYR